MIGIRHLYTLIIITALTTNVQAGSFCETYSHVQLKEKYNANFLNKDFQGCFSYRTDSSSANEAQGLISIRLGDNLTNVSSATTAKLAYETFSSIVNLNRAARALTDDVNQTIQNIRSDSRTAIAQIDKDLIKYQDIYSRDAIVQIRENVNDLRSDSVKIFKKAEIIQKKAAALSSKTNEILYPDLSIDRSKKNLSAIEKEKSRWSEIKSNRQMPFRSVEKIYRSNNPGLTDQLLSEIKAHRYVEQGLIKNIKNTPVLNAVIKYENTENLYYQKLELINKNPSLTTGIAPKDIKIIKEISAELKKEADDNLIKGNLETANDSIDLAHVALDLATSLPLISSGRGLFEFFTGRSLIDGHELNATEKGISLGMALIDLTPAAVFSKGAKVAGILGTTATRLAERGLVKAGLEESLDLSVKYAETFARVTNHYLSQGILKYETIKTIVEHKLFFKFIDYETFISSDKFARNLIRFEEISSTLAKSGIEATPNLNHYLANIIHYEKSLMGDSELLEHANKYIHYESKFKALNATAVDNLAVTRISEKPYYPFNTNDGWLASNTPLNHRLSMPGEPALYSVIGQDQSAIKAAMAEVEITAQMLDNFIIETKSFSSTKVLDLTDAKNLEILGLKEAHLLSNSYASTQKIGHLAKMNGYDAIILSGAKEVEFGSSVALDRYKNYILLRGF